MLKGFFNIGLTVVLLVCAAVILISALAGWLSVLRTPRFEVEMRV